MQASLAIAEGGKTFVISECVSNNNVDPVILEIVMQEMV